MAKLSYKVSYYVLYAMFAIILVVLGLFYFGGDAKKRRQYYDEYGL